MTIRDHLNRRASLAAWPVITLAVVAIVMVLTQPTELMLNLAAVAVLVVLALSMSALCMFRCPRCKASLGALVGHFGPLRRLGRHARCCPFCATDFDTPLGP